MIRRVRARWSQLSWDRRFLVLFLGSLVLSAGFALLQFPSAAVVVVDLGFLFLVLGLSWIALGYLRRRDPELVPEAVRRPDGPPPTDET